MERVLYNTILGAKPILPDGTSFYYSDYNETAKKVYYAKMAVLLGHIPAGDGRLWHQRIYASRAGCVREPVRAVGAALTAGVHADADDGVSRISQCTLR